MYMDDSATLYKELLLQYTEYIEQSFLSMMELEVVHEKESEWPTLPVQ